MSNQNISKATTSLTLTIGVALSLLSASDAEAITRVRPTTEVGKHVFQAEGGISGSFEEFAEGGSGAWTLGWSYHADRSLGIGISVGGNKPEDLPAAFDDLTQKFTENFTGSFTYLTMDFHVRETNRSAFVPRVMAGFGYYELDFKATLISTGREVERIKDGRFGMRFGAGLDYLVTPTISVGVVADYHFISLDPPGLLDDATLESGLGNWYDTWDFKAVVSLYTH